MFRALLISIHSECSQLASSATSTPCWVGISTWKPPYCQARYFFKKLNQLRASVLNKRLKQREKITLLDMVVKIQVSLCPCSWTKTNSSFVLQKLLPQRNWFLKKNAQKNTIEEKSNIFPSRNLETGQYDFYLPSRQSGKFSAPNWGSSAAIRASLGCQVLTKFLPTQSWDKLLKLSISVANPEAFRAFLNTGF